ncbi:MAG: hypothetical protein IJC56_09260, partial [Clostridia bacterium]|nr:hypothetical protein [Clostridia bacterium]
MPHISEHDRGVLRAIARRHLEYANSPCNAELLAQWDALAHGRRETPTVRLLFSNFAHEVITPRQQCEGDAARAIEFGMLWKLVGRELFDDDTPLSPTFDVSLHARVRPFGMAHQITRASGEHAMGFHIDPVITDLEEDFHLLEGGSFRVDKDATRRELELMDDILGDILPVRMVQPSLTAAITNPLVHLM